MRMNKIHHATWHLAMAIFWCAILSAPRFAVVAQEAEVDAEGNLVSCKNDHYKCDSWAKAGECDENPGYMLYSCRVACNSCAFTTADIQHRVTAALQKKQQEEEAKRIEYENFGVVQQLRNEAQREWFEESRRYMQQTIRADPKFEEVHTDCQNRHEDCTDWAVHGECTNNPKYMEKHCAVACKTCHKLIFTWRCPFDNETAHNVWVPGDLHTMFERIEREYSSNDAIKEDLNILSRDPWVITIDNFLTPQETDRLIELGGNRGYEKSMDVGKKKFDGTYGSFDSPSRTSSNTWCLDKCFQDDSTKVVIQRIENLTGVPDPFAEYLQLLRYEVGQFYGVHHDYIPHLRSRAEGPRIATVFLYLNDVPQGGGTNFPLLNITVMPKKGRVLVWPSVLNHSPHDKDDRTDHQALPVEEGIKFGANAWLHMRDFKDAFSRGCA